MNFQSMLAKRYILTQKRHSILTICSIIVALTFMSMLFTLFTTYFTSARNFNYDKAPYHCMIESVTKEQGEALATAEGITSCVLKANPDGETYAAELMLEKYTKDEVVVLKAAFDKAGLSDMDGSKYYLNVDLMQFDLVGINAWFTVAATFALFFVFIIILCMAMRLVIDTAFEISSKERERQFGVLQSIGATPGQVVKIITVEGSMLSVIGIPIGLVCGIGIAYLAYSVILNSELLEAIIAPDKIEKLVCFTVNPWMILVSALTGYAWVWISAYSTGMRIIKMSPMQAITNRTNTVKKVRRHTLYGLLFGWVGKLASRNASRSRKRFWITVVSLTTSITLFATTSFVLDGYIDGYEEYLKAEGINFDFGIDFENDDNYPVECDFSDYYGYVKELEDCGYFKDISYAELVTGRYEKTKTVYINYYNEEAYQKLFAGKPPISYEELAASDQYIMVQKTQEDARPEEWKAIEEMQRLDEIPAEITDYVIVTEEEYAALSEEERNNVNERSAMDEETGEKFTFYSDKVHVPKTFSIAHYCPREEVQGYFAYNGVDIVGTVEQYEKNSELYKNFVFHGHRFECNLTDHELHEEAVKFLDNHREVEDYFDVYIMNYANRSSFTLTKIILLFIGVMIALISIVNMVNIISTGILNRRGELAAMQCVGMTRGQMYGMTVVECMHYVLTSGIVASLLTVGIMYATKLFLRWMTLEVDFGDVISYTEPLTTVWICTVAAFAVALITAFISVHSLQKQTLVDQIRSVD